MRGRGNSGAGGAGADGQADIVPSGGSIERSKITQSAVFLAFKQYVGKTFLVGLEGGERLFDRQAALHGVIDSFGVVGIVTFLESEFGVTYSDEELLSPDLSSVEGMARMVEAKQAKS